MVRQLFRWFAGVLALGMSGSLTITAARAAPEITWQDADIGAPAAAGSHTYVPLQHAITVSGAGTGDASGKDQLHFTYKAVPAGDVEFVVRISAIDGGAHTRAGIMLRSDNSPGSARAAAGFELQQSTTAMPDGEKKLRNYVYSSGYDLGAVYTRRDGGYFTDLAPPQVWLRIIRVGSDFSVEKSPDGAIWSMVHNESGGAFTPTVPFEAGLFVSSGDPAKTVTATFDNISIGKPHLEYHSSWVGNNYSQDSIGYVTGGIGALWVGADGTCYTNSWYDEAGESAKIYKDGRVVKCFENGPFGNNEGNEGSITSDGAHMYLACVGSIWQTDMLGHSTASRQLFFSTNLASQSGNLCSGLAVSNGALYVSVARANKVLVAATTKVGYFTAGNSFTNSTAHEIDTTAVVNPAPAEVYQSQRECDELPYVIPGLLPSTAYKVRFHFAEFKEDQPGKRLMRLSAGGKLIEHFDLVAAAGGKFKAYVKELDGAETDANGNLSVVLTRELGGDGHIVINGIEVVKADGADAIAIDCGGPKAGAFQSEVNEDPARDFSFDRPGPIAVDKRGDLWIVQEGGDFPLELYKKAIYPTGVKCYHPDGTYTGRQITDVDHPTSVAYDSTTDHLLVTDNGPATNIRIYSDLSTAPRFTAEFGARGGVEAGKVRGRIYDPAAGGYARFYGLNAVGVDGQGNIYVSCAGTGTDLRKFTPEGKLIWMLGAHHFVDCGDFDPASDGTEMYNPFKHYTLDYKKTAPGSEWSYTGMNWDASHDAPPTGAESGVVRRIGRAKTLVMYSSSQGTAAPAWIFRWDGETAIPCGGVTVNKQGLTEVWVDKNGDGVETPDELSTLPSPGGLQSYAVDQRGDMWFVFVGATPILRHFTFKGFDKNGVPQYGTGTGDYEDIPFPGTGQKISTWGQLARAVYDSDRDVMYLMGPAVDRGKDWKNTIVYLSRYDRWSKGNRTAAWLFTLPDPGTDPNFMYQYPNPYNLAFQWEAFDVAVDKIFVAEQWGPVHVFDAATGKQITIFNAGPEVSGGDAWEDENMGIRAFKRKDGEYIVCEENSGFRAKDNLYRWRP